VRFDFERNGKTIADIDDAGVLARPLQDVLPLARQFLQVDARALIGAVLAPHNAENAQFRERRLAPEQPQNLVVFRSSELMSLDHIRRDLGHEFDVARTGTLTGVAVTSEARMTRPSVPPMSASAARSG